MEPDQFAAALIDASPDGLILVDPGGTITLANPVAASMFGHDVDQLIGTSVDDLVPLEYRRGHARHRASYADRPSVRPMASGLRLFGQTANGALFPVEISLSSVDIDGEQQTIATIRDVSDRQETAAQMAMMQDRERIARDIHDMVIQRLFAAGMNLQAIQGQAEPAIVGERIGTAIDDLDDTIRELRAAIFRLGQQGERRSVSAQITELVHERARHLGFEPTVRLAGDLDHVPDFVADQLIATLTEGLSNIVRHADASNADVHVDLTDDVLSLIIGDNGKGIPNEPKRSGGLSNMMWRAAELGGACTVGPNEPSGTRLHWHVPVD